MGNSIYESFHSRAAKFEEDLLVSFSLTKNALGTKFENFVSSRGFVSKFKILSLCINNYLSVFTTVSSYK